MVTPLAALAAAVVFAALDEDAAHTGSAENVPAAKAAAVSNEIILALINSSSHKFNLTSSCRIPVQSLNINAPFPLSGDRIDYIIGTKIVRKAVASFPQIQAFLFTLVCIQPDYADSQIISVIACSAMDSGSLSGQIQESISSSGRIRGILS